MIRGQMSGPAQQAAVVVVGAGPAGLATAACLQRRGIAALVLEAAPSLGHAWRNHYDRLRLHTVKSRSHLPGLRFGRNVPRYPSRADVLAYLEEYAARFGIAPRTGEEVLRVALSNGADGYVVESSRGVHRARAVVMAAGFNRVPNAARLPEQDAYQGTLLHTSGYRNAQPFAGMRVLVVGGGNTGAEVSLDLAEHGAKPTLSVRAGVNIVPRDFLGLPIQVTSLWMRRLPLSLADRIGRGVSRLAFGDLRRHGLARSPLGPISGIARRGRIPLIDVGTVAAIQRGAISVKPGVARLTATGAVFADGSAAEFDAVILATGFQHGLGDLLAVPGALDGEGHPRGSRGIGAADQVFFVGYRIVATGHLREVGIEAQAVAAAIAAS
jgi:indole-3-pyruvate monooxygenase